MKLYVRSKQNPKKKIYLRVSAKTRRQLAQKIGYHFQVNRMPYSINEVYAESSSNDTAGGALIGGLIGLLGGGVGVALGGLAGGIIGKAKDDVDKKEINHFNRSRA